jgi:hypothetical protein
MIRMGRYNLLLHKREINARLCRLIRFYSKMLFGFGSYNLTFL